MTILYEVHQNIYVNITNRCSSACVFCLRQNRDHMDNSGSLWLEREPSLEEIKSAFKNRDISKYNAVVFCGFGEPTERLDVLLQAAKFVKNEYNKPVRINTNGQGDLINGKNIAPLFEGIFDAVSVSMNTPDEKRYHELVRSRYGDLAFQAMLTFAGNVKHYVPSVTLSTVATTITKEEEQACANICRNLQVSYRIRAYEEQ